MCYATLKIMIGNSISFFHFLNINIDCRESVVITPIYWNKSPVIKSYANVHVAVFSARPLMVCTSILCYIITPQQIVTLHI